VLQREEKEEEKRKNLIEKWKILGVEIK